MRALIPFIFIFSLLQSIEASHLTEIEMYSDDSFVKLHLKISGELPEVHIEQKNIDGTHTALIHLSGVESSEVEALQLLNPIHFLEVIKKDTTAKITLYLYLKKKVEVTHTMGEGEVIIELPWLEPEVTSSASHIKTIDDNILESKASQLNITFDEIPGNTHIFLSQNKTHLVGVFLNTTPLSDPPSLQLPDFIESIEWERGIDTKDAPFVRFILVAKEEIEYEPQEEDNHISIELSPFIKEAAIPEASYDSLLKSSAIELAGESESSEGNARKHEAVIEKEKSHTWLYVSIGAGVLAAGGIGAYFYANKATPPTTSKNIIPGPGEPGSGFGWPPNP